MILCDNVADLNKMQQFMKKLVKKAIKKRGRCLQRTAAFFTVILILLFNMTLKKAARFFNERFTAIQDWWEYFVWSVKYTSKSEGHPVVPGG